MKKLLILLFSLLISFNSYGEWIHVSITTDSGNLWYVDKDTIKKKDGFTYFWSMHDYKKIDSFGNMSAQMFLEADCSLFRIKYLTQYFYKKPMGAGIPKTVKGDSNWDYLPPGSNMHHATEYACKN